MKFYVQLRKNSVVADVIEYPKDGYIEILTDEPLPIGITGGWFKYENGEFVEHPELKPEDPIETKLAELAVDTDYRLSLLELGLN